LLSSDVSKVDNALALLDKIEKQGAPLPTTAGTILKNWKDKNITQSKDKAALEEALRIYNRINKDDPIIFDRFDASQLRGKLETLKSTINTDLENQRQQSQQRQLTPAVQSGMPSGRAKPSEEMETHGVEVGRAIAKAKEDKDPKALRDIETATNDKLNAAAQNRAKVGSSVVDGYNDQLKRIRAAREELEKRPTAPAGAAPAGKLQPGKVYTDKDGNRAIYEGKDSTGKDKWRELR
jgi:hypothetical protein